MFLTIVSFTSVILKLVGGNEPSKFYADTHRAYLKIQKISINKHEPKVNYASFAHKFILFKKTKPIKHELTQKHNSINICDKSMCLILLHFGNNSKNARLYFGKAHGNKVCSFFCFYVYHLQKRLLAKICYNKLYEYLKGFRSKKRVSYNLVTPIR